MGGKPEQMGGVDIIRGPAYSFGETSPDFKDPIRGEEPEKLGELARLADLDQGTTAAADQDPDEEGGRDPGGWGTAPFKNLSTKNVHVIKSFFRIGSDSSNQDKVRADSGILSLEICIQSARNSSAVFYRSCRGYLPVIDRWFSYHVSLYFFPFLSPRWNSSNGCLIGAWGGNGSNQQATRSIAFALYPSRGTPKD